MLEVYRGSPNQWECDEMGHMNVRFYVSRFMEGLAVLAASCGMPEAFLQRASSTLAPKEMHIRFMKEALAGAPLFMRAGVLDIREDQALIYMELRHLNQEVCATYRGLVEHIDVITRQSFDWSKKTSKKLSELLVEAPAELGPRSIDMTTAPRPDMRIEEAEAVGAVRAGLSAVRPHICDVHGYINPEMYLACLSDSASNLTQPYRDAFTKAEDDADIEVRVGSAVVEYRIVFRDWPRAGQLISVHSSLGAAHGKARSYVHWLMDPLSGEAWGSAETVSLIFDLETRRSLTPSLEATALLEKLVPKGLQV